MKHALMLFKLGCILGLIPLLMLALNLPSQIGFLKDIAFINWIHIAAAGFVLGFICYVFFIKRQSKTVEDKPKSQNIILLAYVISTPLLIILYIYANIIENTAY